MGGMLTDTPDLMFQDTNCDGLDGQAADGVFVATTGSDNDDGSMADPKRTVPAGIDLAAMRPSVKHVYIATGVYNERINLRSGVNIYGGYQSDNMWRRTRTTPTTIASATSEPAITGTTITEETEVQLVTARSLDAGTMGASSYATRFLGCSGSIVLRGVTFISGNGGAGVSAAAGTRGPAH